MAKRKYTQREERALIERAEAARDSDAPLTLVPSRVREDATGVLSVRLPLAQIRMLREIAARRGVGLSALLQDVASNFAVMEAQRMYVSRSASRVHVQGIELQSAYHPEESSSDYQKISTREVVRTGS